MAWNKPSTENQQKKPSAKAPSAKRGILAGAAIVVALGALYLYLFTNGEATSSSLQKKDRGRIKEVTPAKAQTNRAEAVRVPEKERGKQVFSKGRLERDRRNGRVYVPPAHTSRVYHVAHEIAIFESPADQALAMVLTTEPGETLVGDPSSWFGKKFKKALESSIADKPDFKPEDTDYDHELKQQVYEAKKELYERIRGGEDAQTIMRDTFNELQHLGIYKQELNRMVNEAIRDGSMSDEDVQDTLDAANKMLAERGVSNIKMPGLFKARARILSKKQQKGELK